MKKLLLQFVLMSMAVLVHATQQTITLPPVNGNSYVGCQVNGPGGNGINNTAFLQVPATFPSAQVYMLTWNCSGFNQYIYLNSADSPSAPGVAGWYDAHDNLATVSWNPGQGVVIRNTSTSSGSFTLNGTTPIPVLPPTNACGCGEWSFLSSQTSGGTSTYQQIMGVPPVSGSEVAFTYTNIAGPLDIYSNGSWTPTTPILINGLTNAQAAFFFVPCTTTNCITIVSSNLVAYAPCNSNCVIVPLAASAIDNCCTNGVTLQYYEGGISIPASGTCFNVGTTPITVVATDACGNSVTNTFEVIVEPLTGITIQSSNETVYTCTNCTTVPFQVTASDPCCSNGLTVSYNYPTNYCFPVNSTTPVTVLATDGCGNVASNTFDVTVYSCTNPCITILSTNLVAYTCNSNCVIVPLTATAIDNCCSNVTLQYYEGGISIPAAGNCFNLGITPVTVVASDGCGDIASNSFTVTVNPSANPPAIISCPTNITICMGTTAGTIIADSDEWALSDQGFGLEGDGAVYADNCAAYLTGGRGTNILIYSSNFGLDGIGTGGMDFTNALMNAGYNVTLDTPPTPTLTLSYLSGFNAVFVGGDALTTNELLALEEYVCDGGGVYIAAGTGKFDSAAAEAAQWNILLNPFGLTMANTYNSIESVITVGGGTLTVGSSPVMNGVNALDYVSGNDVSVIGGDPLAQVIAYSGSEGLIGVSGCVAIATNGCGVMPDETGLVIVSAGGMVTQSPPPGTTICSNTIVTFTVSNLCGEIIQTNVPCELINCASNSCLQIVSTNLLAYAPCGSNCAIVPLTATAIDTCCSNVTLQYYLGTVSIPAAGTCFNVGITPVTVVATDACSNSATSQFDVIVQQVGGSITIQYTNETVYTCSNCTMVPFLVSAQDPCCPGNNVTLSYDFPTNYCFSVNSTNLVEVFATDPCGNSNNASFTVTVLSSTNCSTCCTNCNPPYPASYSVTVNPGFNYLADNLCQGTNAITGFLTNAPNGSQILLWNGTGYTSGSIRARGSWSPSLSLTPGEGFVLNVPAGTASFTVTILGCEPSCPPPCVPTNGLSLVGTLGIMTNATWTNLFSCPPPCGAQMQLWNPASGSFTTYNYANGVWTPSVPVLAVGESAFVTVLPCTNCISLVCSNLFASIPCTNTCVVVPLTATAIDNCCSNVTLQYYEGTIAIPAAGTCFAAGTTPITVVATDACTNSATNSFNVIVQQLAGTITIHATNELVYTCSNCTMVPFQVSASDPCCSNSATLFYDYPTNYCFSVNSTNMVTVFATDPCGNSNSTSFTVTVLPGTNCCSLSVLSTNLLAFVPCNSNCIVVLLKATAIDNCCSNVTFQYSEGGIAINPTNNCFSVGTNLVTVLATDGCGHTATNVFDVIVHQLAGTITIHATNELVYTCSNCTMVPFQASASDPCCSNNVTLSYDYPTNYCFSVNSTNMVTVFATNSCGDIGSTNFTVTVLPGTNCCSLSVLSTNLLAFVPCNSNCIVVLLKATAIDNCCSNVAFQYSEGGIAINPTNNCFSVGTNLVTVLATDGCGHTATNVFDVIVHQLAGTITIHATNELVYTCSNCTMVPFQVSAFDPCCSNSATLFYDYPTNYCFSVNSTNMVTVFATNSCGDIGSTNFTVTVLPATNSLQFNCLTNLTVQCGTLWTSTPPRIVSSCCSSNAVFLLTSVTNGTCPKYITNSWRISDSCGDTDSCTQVITVEDTNPPVITGGTNTVTGIITTNCELVIPFVSVTATDSCTPQCSLGQYQSPTNGTIVPGPSAYVTVTVTDLCGNAAQCKVLVQGVYKRGLVVTWPTQIVSTNCLVPCVTPTIVDCSCPSNTIQIVQDPPCDMVIGPGHYTIRVRVTDCHGLTAEKTIPLTELGAETSFLNVLTNTGIAANGSLLPQCAVDPHYTCGPVTTSAGGCTLQGYHAPQALAVNDLWPWMETPHVSEWISPNCQLSQMYQSPYGFYTYTNRFVLPPGIVASTASISGRWTADDGAVAMIFNGTATPNTINSSIPGWYWSYFTIKGNFLPYPQVNTVLFVVTNNQAVGCSPTGLRVEYLAANACSTCSPPTIISFTIPQDPVFYGSSVTFNVKAVPPPLTYQWQLNGHNIPGANGMSYHLSHVTWTSSGIYSVIVSNACGVKAAAGPLAVIFPMPWTNAWWTFDNFPNPLSATFGPDLLMNNNINSGTNFSLSIGNTEDLGLPNPGGQVVNVLGINPLWPATLTLPPVLPAGSTSNANYTVIMDIYQADTSEGTPSTLFESASDGSGIALTLDASNYLDITGTAAGAPFDVTSTIPMSADTWHRVALVVSGPVDGVGGSVLGYLDGIPINTGPAIPFNCPCCYLNINSGIFYTNSATILTGTNTVIGNGELYISGLQFHAVALPPQIIAALSGPDSGPEPNINNLSPPSSAPALSASVAGGTVNFTWPGGGFVLQEATDLTSGEWTDSQLPFTQSADASGNVTTAATVAPSSGAPVKFYRLVFRP